jgi:hypothetical protein
VTDAPSLLEAFRAFGPCLGIVEVDRSREAAAACLLQELRAVARRTGFPAAVRDDAIQIVLARLCRVGPRGLRHGDPATSGEVRGYLTRAVQRAARDLVWRERQRPLEPERARTLAGSDPDPLETAALAEALALLDAVEVSLAEVVRVAAQGLRDVGRERFLGAVDELRAIADGREDFDRLVGAQTASGADTTTAANRLYQRYSRALRRLVRTVDAQARAGLLSETERRLLRLAIDRLRLRHGGRGTSGRRA